jgi:anti-sigma regulatory factor (Ser/Thr protein kinase)
MRGLETSGSLGRDSRQEREAASALDDVLGGLLEQAADILSSDTALIVLSGPGRRMLASAHGGLEERIARALGVSPDGVLSVEPPAVAVSDVAAAHGVHEALEASGVQSLLAAPLICDERFVGTMVVGTLGRRAFGVSDAKLLDAFAERAAVELAHDGLVERHRRAWSLQRSVLPAWLPRARGVTVAARYLPAAHELGAGGGWYDAFLLPDGRVALAIGDVASRGRHAAALAGELRSVLRAYALEGDGPVAVVAKMWHFVDALERGEMASVLYAVHDPVERSVRFCSVGHPGPVFVRADATATHAIAEPAAPLGAGGPPHGAASEAELEPAATMVLYTDGLAERPGERLAERRDRITWASAGSPDPDAVCRRLLSRLVDGRPPDDVVVLALQAAAATDHRLERTLPADARELGSLRRELRRWLADHGADEREIAALTLAAQEACANAVEHAYGAGDETFDLAALADGGTVEITVTDRGQWRLPRGEHRGRGLALMRALVDEVDLATGERGTTVRLIRRLGAHEEPR